MTTFAGTTNSGLINGIGTNAKFFNPTGLAVNSAGTVLYVADNRNCNIRTIVLPSGNIFNTIS